MKDKFLDSRDRSIESKRHPQTRILEREREREREREAKLKTTPHPH